jgi:hypothetical protein
VGKKERNRVGKEKRRKRERKRETEGEKGRNVQR